MNKKTFDEDEEHDGMGESEEDRYLREHREASGSGLQNTRIADRESAVSLFSCYNKLNSS